MRSFVDGGGVAARLARPAAGAAFEEAFPGEALEVSDEALLALFGRDRAALLRVVGMPMQVDRQKEWKLRDTQKRQMEAAGSGTGHARGDGFGSLLASQQRAILA
mmetsp:Transcript_41415/g.86547  ORF Transcript_41415/g.86547 Transcript_41415/m.86547 type:complete len:105 (-) Transcript_41415:2838-3152(-)